MKRAIQTVVENPTRILVGLNRLYHKGPFSENGNKKGVNFIEEEWDTLIILDACRFDEFARSVDLPGETNHKISLGSTSKEFIRANFSNKILYDTVYVSANGWYEKLRDEINSDVHRFVYTDRDAAGGLTTKPETVTRAALNAFEEHPNKRLIIHYMQPHQPYLGPAGEKIDHGAALSTTVRKNQLGKETLWSAYRENLQLAINEVRTVLKEMSGKTVVTADHGELLGEQQSPIPIRDYGHPLGIYVDELVKVPWHVYENGERKIVSANSRFSEERENQDRIEEHLTNLGYRV